MTDEQRQQIADMKEKLAARAQDVARHLLPAGKLDKHGEWCCGSLDGEEGQSLKVNCNKKPGFWKDFATNTGGDNLLELWHQIRGSIDFPATIAEAKTFLGIYEPEKVRQSVKRSQPAKSFAIPKAAPTDRKLREGGDVWKYLTEERKLSPETLATFEVAEGIVHKDGTDWPAYVFPYKAPDGALEHVKRIGLENVTPTARNGSQRAQGRG